MAPSAEGPTTETCCKRPGVISTMYAVNIGLLAEKRHAYEEAVAEAQSKLDAFPISKAGASKEAANRGRELVRKRNQAQAALHFYEERSRQELRNLINIVRKVGRTEGEPRVGLADGVVGYRLQKPPLG